MSYQTCPCGGTLLTDPDNDNIHCDWCSASMGYYSLLDFLSQEEQERRQGELRLWKLAFEVARGNK